MARRSLRSLPLDYAPRGWKPPPRRHRVAEVEPREHRLLDELGNLLLDESGDTLTED